MIYTVECCLLVLESDVCITSAFYLVEDGLLLWVGKRDAIV